MYSYDLNACRHGERRDQQVAAGAEGVHPRAGHEGAEPPPVPRVQAHAGAARQLHRRQVPHVHDRHDLARHVLLRALAQHAALRRPRQGAGHRRARAPGPRRGHGARQGAGRPRAAPGPQCNAYSALIIGLVIPACHWLCI